MEVKIINLTLLDKFVQSLPWNQWQKFRLPIGETIPCWKDRSMIQKVGRVIDWHGTPELTHKTDPSKVGRDGVGVGTPMQLGNNFYRAVTWGSGYGRFNQFVIGIPKPFAGGRYWITGYPSTAFDKRCIIHSLDDQHTFELIQYDQDLPVLPAGFPQQALNAGEWFMGKLIDGVSVSASGLPGHSMIWGPGSLDNPHVQSMTVINYHGGDGERVDHKNPESDFVIPETGVTCGDWYVLPVDSESYKTMVANGGECAARAKAMSVYGVKNVDRGNMVHFLTQAGTWALGTNISEFQININDLRMAS